MQLAVKLKYGKSVLALIYKDERIRLLCTIPDRLIRGYISRLGFLIKVL